MKRSSLVVVLFLCGGIFVHSWQVGERKTPPAYPKHDFSKSKSYRVVRVVDGDTIIISKDGKDVRVRLIGVDTPETVHPTKKVQFYGREASQFTKNLLKGESVWLKYDGTKPTTDKYRRLLAYVHRVPDGLFVNCEIVRQGYGQVYTNVPFQYTKMFLDYQRRARKAGRGLWGGAREVIVYRTRSSKTYHRAGCRYVKKGKIRMTLEEAKKKGCRACRVCLPPR